MCLVYAPSSIGQKSINTSTNTINSSERQPNVVLPENIESQKPTADEQAILRGFEFSTLLEATQENMQALALYIRHGDLRPSQLDRAKRTLARIQEELGIISKADLEKYN